MYITDPPALIDIKSLIQGKLGSNNIVNLYEMHHCNVKHSDSVLVTISQTSSEL